MKPWNRRLEKLEKKKAKMRKHGNFQAIMSAVRNRSGKKEKRSESKVS